MPQLPSAFCAPVSHRVPRSSSGRADSWPRATASTSASMIRAVPYTGFSSSRANWFPNHKGSHAAIGALFGSQVSQRPCNSLFRAHLLFGRQVIVPGQPGPYGMCGQVCSAPIEGERSPAATKRGNATVTILQIEQPLHTGDGSGSHGVIRIAKVVQCQQRTRSVVRIGHAAGQIGPCPATGLGVRVRMLRPVLLCEQPMPDAGSFIWR